ncbi:hypothetical protein AB204_10555 [Xenorhabdus khoisanae]|uniref:Uncharacterized protein n=1 Tax=Xenorhabdus khoisanae TaxID=880157 RepID=A0A0J5IPJ1_9GAMM|nr:hypothetical protein [Xenorhabdus khoisanae]KMJ45130.1 hypothetical protein AB204_10555 [Xenorhabdus khoisanae]
MKKTNPRIEHEITTHLAEIYHKGSTYIPLFKILHWFEKDGGKITKAFFIKEIFSRWADYLGKDDHTVDFPISVINVLSDHSVAKPEGYIIFQNSFLYINADSKKEEDIEEDDDE